ncbi:MAG: hypothetical protein LIP16_10410 [Clostridium sp.]|nr:hypothetical protein [Clostridium sp.]
MKKWLIGVMVVMTAVSLAACTPTTEKQQNQTTAAEGPQESMVPQSTGGASDKVPDPNVMPVAVISIYHGTDNGLIQDMDSLDTEGLDAQLLVDKLIEYGVLTEGTEVLSFDVEGREGESAQGPGAGDQTQEIVGTLDLNQAESAQGYSDEMFLTELGNTFTENFELSKLKLKVNGANFEGDTIKQGDDDYLSYNTNYESVE